MLRFIFFGGFYERDGFLVIMNIMTWGVTLLIFAFAYSVIDEVNGTSHTESSMVTSIGFIPEHTQLIGKVIVIMDDEWIVKLSNGVSCSSSVDYFSVGDSVVVDYTAGGLSESKYCNAIKKTNIKEISK